MGYLVDRRLYSLFAQTGKRVSYYRMRDCASYLPAIFIWRGFWLSHFLVFRTLLVFPYEAFSAFLLERSMEKLQTCAVLDTGHIPKMTKILPLGLPQPTYAYECLAEVAIRSGHTLCVA